MRFAHIIFLFTLICVQSLTMYIVVMNDTTRHKLRSVVLFSGDHIYTDITPQSDPAYINACNESAIKLLRNVFTNMSLIIFSNTLYGCFPMYAFFIKHEIQLALPVFLPFTDIDSVFGLVLNLFNQLLISVSGIVGNYAIEIGTCMIKNSMWAATVAISYAIDNISKSLKQRNPKSSKHCDFEFRNILVQLQDYDR